MVVGYLIRFREWTFLVAGYDRTSSVAEAVVANAVGNTVLRVGLALLAIGVVAAVADLPSYLYALFGVVVLFAVLRLLYRLHTAAPGEAA